MTIGKKIENLRRRKNYTQGKLGDLLGVSDQTIANWEEDINSPSLKQAQTLIQIFNVSYDDLIDDDIDIECSNDGILSKLIGKTCQLDADTDDYRMSSLTKCKIVSINKGYIKIEFNYGKKTITKLIDIDLVSSIKWLTEKEVQK